MANVTKFYTLDISTANNFFSGIWMLSRCMKQAGWTYKSSSDGTTKEVSGSTDKWGNGATPTSDTYALTPQSSACWWNAAGPNIVKIPITSPSTGSFIRGEQVSQGVSAATGELLGYVFDATNGGWLIVAPRTATFDSTHALTGSISAANVNPNGTVKSYSQEVVFWASGTDGVNGTIYWVVADAVAESTKLFSNLARAGNNTGCTATVAPGGGGTNNGFPSLAICVLGTAGANTPSQWATNGTATQHALVSAVNATSGSNSSADGTSWVMFSDTSANTESRLTGLFRLDDTEQGDVAPYEWLLPTSNVIGSYSRTSGPSDATLMTWSNFATNGNVIWNGYVNRGLPGDSAGSYHKTVVPVDATASHPLLVNNVASQVRVQNHPASTKPLFVDTVQIYNDATATQQVKGRARWLRYVSTGNVYDTTDTLTWVVWLGQVTNTNPTVIVGPWDGSTTPAS